MMIRRLLRSHQQLKYYRESMFCTNGGIVDNFQFENGNKLVIIDSAREKQINHATHLSFNSSVSDISQFLLEGRDAVSYDDADRALVTALVTHQYTTAEQITRFLLQYYAQEVNLSSHTIGNIVSSLARVQDWCLVNKLAGNIFVKSLANIFHNDNDLGCVLGRKDILSSILDANSGIISCKDNEMMVQSTYECLQLLTNSIPEHQPSNGELMPIYPHTLIGSLQHMYQLGQSQKVELWLDKFVQKTFEYLAKHPEKPSSISDLCFILSVLYDPKDDGKHAKLGSELVDYFWNKLHPRPPRPLQKSTGTDSSISINSNSAKKLPAWRIYQDMEKVLEALTGDDGSVRMLDRVSGACAFAVPVPTSSMMAHDSMPHWKQMLAMGIASEASERKIRLSAKSFALLMFTAQHSASVAMICEVIDTFTSHCLNSTWRKNQRIHELDLFTYASLSAGRAVYETGLARIAADKKLTTDQRQKQLSVLNNDRTMIFNKVMTHIIAIDGRAGPQLDKAITYLAYGTGLKPMRLEHSSVGKINKARGGGSAVTRWQLGLLPEDVDWLMEVTLPWCRRLLDRDQLAQYSMNWLQRTVINCGDSSKPVSRGQMSVVPHTVSTQPQQQDHRQGFSHAPASARTHSSTSEGATLPVGAANVTIDEERRKQASAVCMLLKKWLSDAELSQIENTRGANISSRMECVRQACKILMSLQMSADLVCIVLSLSQHHNVFRAVFTQSMTTCVHSGDWAGVEDIFQHMRIKGIMPSPAGVKCFVQSQMAQKRQPSRTCDVVMQMHSLGVTAPVETLSMLCACLAACDELNRAEELFQVLLQRHGVQLSVSNRTLARSRSAWLLCQGKLPNLREHLRSCSDHWGASDAKLLQDMLVETCVGVIAQWENWDLAVELVRHMMKHGCSPPAALLVKLFQLGDAQCSGQHSATSVQLEELRHEINTFCVDNSLST